MALDVSKLTSAVNSYLYSISDMNKLLSADSESGSSSLLSGIFQKYLNKALTDETTKELTDDEEINNAISELSRISTGSATGSTFDVYADDSLFSSVLPDLTGTLTSAAKTSDVVKDTETEESDSVKAVVKEIPQDTLALEIQSAFSKMDLAGEIQSNIAGRNMISDVPKNLAGLDIPSEIQRSIASHDRTDEISEKNSYAANKLQSYKPQATNTSVFGDYRL